MAATDATFRGAWITQSSARAPAGRQLQAGREALLWNLGGVSEYDARRPLVPTGTNLLGPVKHVAGVEAGYVGDTFGRPFGDPLPWFEDGAEPEWWQSYRSRLEHAAQETSQD